MEESVCLGSGHTKAVQRQLHTQERSLADVIPPSLAPELRECAAGEEGSKYILSILIIQTVIFRSDLQLEVLQLGAPRERKRRLRISSLQGTNPYPFLISHTVSFMVVPQQWLALFQDE